MTREEAVNELNDRIKAAEYVNSDYIDCVSVNAVKMAISALSVPDTNVGDLISRQTLRIDMYHEVFEKGSDEQRWDSGCWIRYKMFERVVDRQPSAQPERCEDCRNFNKARLLIPQSERKKGKWKMNKDGNWACPFCEFDPYHDNMKGMNYCPNCGAKMEGEEDA